MAQQQYTFLNIKMKSNNLCENTSMTAYVNLTHVTSPSPVKAYEFVLYTCIALYFKHHTTSTFLMFQIKDTIQLQLQLKKKKRLCQTQKNTDKRTFRRSGSAITCHVSSLRVTAYLCKALVFSRQMAVTCTSALFCPVPMLPAVIKSQWSLLHCYDRATYPTSERTQ